jgi:hypothetical protein
VVAQPQDCADSGFAAQALRAASAGLGVRSALTAVQLATKVCSSTRGVKEGARQCALHENAE